MAIIRKAILGFLLVLLIGGAAWGQEEGKQQFSMSGFIQTQFGVFISQYENRVGIEGYPKEHGGMYGKPSMFRNTLQLDASWQPLERAKLTVVFRGVRSAELEADQFAQYPDMYADTTFNHDPHVQSEKISRVAEEYYQEADFRELFLDIYATDWWSFRIGKQQVAWGESGNARLLDIINPVDSTWHLSPFEEFADQQVPLWIAQTLFDISPINASIEGVFVPNIDRERDRQTIPLTFVGAWGLPVAPKNDYLSDLEVVKKTCVSPKGDLSDARWGVKWKQILGDFTYTLVYYHGHHLTPPIQDYAEQTKEPNERGFREVEVFLHFPREDVLGASFEWAMPEILGSPMLRFEGTYLPQCYFPVNSYLSPGVGTSTERSRGWYQSPVEDGKLRADFHQEAREVFNYGVMLERQNQIRFINPTSSIFTRFQLVQTFIPEGPYIDEEFADGSKEENENWYITSITGYDTTKIDEIQTQYIFATFTSYIYGMLTPKIIAVYDENSKSMILSNSLALSFGDNWRILAAYNFIEGAKPYEGLGLFRDRDELNMRIRYQF